MREKPDNQGPSVMEVLGELVNLSAGVGIILLPLFTIAIPGVLLMLVLPALLLALVAAAPLVIAAVFLTPPILLVRTFRRMRSR